MEKVEESAAKQTSFRKKMPTSASRSSSRNGKVKKTTKSKKKSKSRVQKEKSPPEWYKPMESSELEISECLKYVTAPEPPEMMTDEQTKILKEFREVSSVLPLQLTALCDHRPTKN